MSSFNRRFLLMGSAALGLSACGFTPAYAPGGAANRLQGEVMIDAPDSRDGYLLVRELEDRLGRASGGRYALAYAIDTAPEAIAIASDNVTTRFNLLGQVTYALREVSGGQVVASGKVDNFTSFSASGSTVATQAAERDAQERLMKILAEQIVTRLIAGAADLPA